MRKIKFRIWNIKEKFMLNVGELQFLQGGVYVYGPGAGQGWAECVKPEHDDYVKTMELMQYTGLKDKNGREIYEGDIIRDTNSKKVRSVFSVPGGYAVHTFDDLDNWFYEDLGNQQNRSWCESCCEVIGNIYENKELLEVTL